MISRFGLLKRRSGSTPAEFDAHWKSTHGQIAARFPGLRKYFHHFVVDPNQFGITNPRGAWHIDGFSELEFDSLDAMRSAIESSSFSTALSDETAFLDDVHLVACEKRFVVPRTGLSGPAVKRMTILRKRPELTDEEFRHEWQVTHANWVSQWPNVLGYAQNLVVDRYHGSRTVSAPYSDVPVDGIVEFWFESQEKAAETYATDLVRRTQEHASTFLAEITPFFVETRQIV